MDGMRSFHQGENMTINTFFPAFGVGELSRRRGRRWAELVMLIHSLPLSDKRVMAFTLTMRQLHKLLNPGQSLCDEPLCTLCTSQIMAEFNGSDEELLAIFNENLQKIEYHLQARARRRNIVVRRFRKAIA